MHKTAEPPNAATAGAQSRGTAPGFVASGVRRVWRIEHPETGRGMYTHRPSTVHLVPTTAAEHPCPADDLRLSSTRARAGRGTYPEKWERFGFVDLDQLRRWMHRDEWFSTLAQNGYVLAEVQVPAAHVCIGDTQCTYDSREVLAVRRYPILPEHPHLPPNMGDQP